MFPYRVKYTDSESDIHNINLLYEIYSKCRNTFETLENVEHDTNSNLHYIFCLVFIIDILQFL